MKKGQSMKLVYDPEKLCSTCKYRSEVDVHTDFAGTWWKCEKRTYTDVQKVFKTRSEVYVNGKGFCSQWEKTCSEISYS